MASGNAPRTSFRFDMMPWKLVFCEFPLKTVRSGGMAFEHCAAHTDGITIRIADLPTAPEPGRIPKGCDHLHIVKKFSGERDAREEEKWRSLLMSTARCDHGQLQGDACKGCRGFAPNQAGLRIGTTHRRKPVVIPQREDMTDITNWIEDD